MTFWLKLIICTAYLGLVFGCAVLLQPSEEPPPCAHPCMGLTRQRALADATLEGCRCTSVVAP